MESDELNSQKSKHYVLGVMRLSTVSYIPCHLWWRIKNLKSFEESMFWTEEDVQPIVQIAEEMFGPNGNMLEGKNITKNVLIGTKEFGKIWYGDVDGDVQFVTDMCTAMSTRVSTTVMQVDESF
jgi:hypothetical protein